MFTNQSFTENKAVINGEHYKYLVAYLTRDFICQKIHPLRDAAFGADYLTPFRILKIVIVGLKWILVMLSGIATCCKNFQILISSPR